MNAAVRAATQTVLEQQQQQVHMPQVTPDKQLPVDAWSHRQIQEIQRLRQQPVLERDRSKRADEAAVKADVSMGYY